MCELFGMSARQPGAVSAYLELLGPLGASRGWVGGRLV
jgi:hypothetical protein